MKVLQVEIKRKPHGGFLYPDFDKLQVVKDSLLEWEGKASAKWPMYIDEYGSGWMYDKTSDHRSISVNSPRGTWLGIMAVPDDFADQADAMFSTCTVLTDGESETFYEGKHTIFAAAESPMKTWADKKANIGM
jgi:hypothetical protein